MIDLCGASPVTIVKTFKHAILDRNGYIIAYLITTVNGDSQQIATGNGITLVSGRFTNVTINTPLNIRVVYGTNSANVYVTLNGVDIAKSPIIYRINASGQIYEAS